MSIRRALKLEPAVRPAAEPLAVARPFIPPADAILPYLRAIDDRRWYSNFGPLLTEFELRLGRRLDAPTVTVVNGTQGLALTLTAMGLAPGSLVALPAWTFVATAHAVLQAGLTPWFLDVDEQTWRLTPQIVTAALPRAPGPVSAVIVVAPFGQPFDSAEWVDLRESTGLQVLIDAAAAFDAVTEAALPTVISLHATKALGIGEGGVIACRDQALLDRLRRLTSFGFQGSRDALVPATNAKLSEYAAAVGMAALDLWPTTRLRYARAAQTLRIALSGVPEVRFQEGWGTHWVSTVCVVGLPPGATDAVEARMADRGVVTRRWWGGGCHTQPAFADQSRTALAVTERLAASTLGLPFCIDMDFDQIGHLAEVLSDALISR